MHALHQTRRSDAYRNEIEAQASLEVSEMLLTKRVARPHPHVEHTLVHALRSRWDRTAAVVRCASDLLLLNPELATLVAKPDQARALLRVAVERAASSELFAALVQCAPVNNLRIERLLVALRDYLAGVLPATAEEVRVAAMIATQARWVEYLWPDTRNAQRPVPMSGNSSAESPVESEQAHAIHALVESMCRAPGLLEISAIARLESEPAVRELLALIRDEPAIEAKYRRQLELPGLDATFAPAIDAQAPRGARVVGSRGNAVRDVGMVRPRAVPQPVRALTSDGRFDRPHILLVGCRDARQPVTVHATWPGAHLTAIDWSATRLVHAMRTWECADVEHARPGIAEFVATDLLDIPARGAAFDLVQCTADAHCLPHTLAGCTAIARCARPGAILRLDVLSGGARRNLHALQVGLEKRGSVYGMAELRTLREELLAGCYGALPGELLEHPDFFTASGLRRLLLAHDDDVPEPSGWIGLIESVGFGFVCVEANDVLTHAARCAAKHDCDAWNLRDWERFERGRAPLFGGEYSLWFVRDGD